MGLSPTTGRKNWGRFSRRLRPRPKPAPSSPDVPPLEAAAWATPPAWLLPRALRSASAPQKTPVRGPGPLHAPAPCGPREPPKSHQVSKAPPAHDPVGSQALVRFSPKQPDTIQQGISAQQGEKPEVNWETTAHQKRAAESNSSLQPWGEGKLVKKVAEMVGFIPVRTHFSKWVGRLDWLNEELKKSLQKAKIKVGQKCQRAKGLTTNWKVLIQEDFLNLKRLVACHIRIPDSLPPIPQLSDGDNCSRKPIDGSREKLSYLQQNMEKLKPQPGDLIEIFRIGYEHWAIYVEDDCVVHLAPPSEEFEVGSITSIFSNRAVVKYSHLNDVLHGCSWKVNNKLDGTYLPLPVDEIMQRTKQMVNKIVQYSLIEGNCEHFVNNLRYGVSRSQQVEHVLMKGAKAAGVVISAVVDSMKPKPITA
ncbi:phospholipase A and acyltransferase 5 isoform X1 [Erinaceus europaeus]|uniref:Phospholipase A and acyltransferase 5 isoform X1 n=2 Tax=Boreoeutheria TaxID=1437010 RepID=A0ABM3W6Y8_ERIEU|nr:phospholipase A and acyltransferase 5 isoform X1 [Erinaceus europaeus]